MKKLLLLLLTALILISFVSAFQLEKKLVQLEVDENYPCYIEGVDTIVCPKMNDFEIDGWKYKLDNLKQEEKDKGKLTDKQKKDYLTNSIIPYESPATSKAISIRNEYREKINPYSLKDGETIKIGFATNVFGVSGTPLENFDVNTATGMVRYRPLNMTWLSFDTIESYTGFGVSFQSQTMGSDASNILKNKTLSIWVFRTGNTSRDPGYIIDFDSGNEATLGIRMGNGTIGYNNTICFGGVHSTIDRSPGNYTCSTNNLSTNEWHHILGIVNDTHCSLYIDGVLNNTEYCGNGNTPVAKWVYLGCALLTSNCDGKYHADELRYYNYSLTQTEINEIYNSKRVSNHSLDYNGIKIYSPINEDSKTFIRNFFSKNGTIVYSDAATWQSDNINVTTLGYDVNISIVNITNALLFYDNYTLINQSETSNRTFTFFNNQTIYILENFNLTEGKTRANSPIWFSVSNATTRHIANNVTATINTSVIITLTGMSCNQIYNITYETDTGTRTDWYGSKAKDVCTNLTTIGQILAVDTASSSNILDIQSDSTPPVITVVSPTASKKYNLKEDILISFSAIDDIGVNNYWYYDGTKNISYIIPKYISLSNKRSYTYIFYANDTSGNIASESRTFSIVNPGVDSACTESDLSFIEASAIAGMIMTIILVGGVLTILFVSFNGILEGFVPDLNFDLSKIGIEEIITSIFIIGLTFLIIATMAYLIGGSYCPAIS